MPRTNFTSLSRLTPLISARYALLSFQPANKHLLPTQQEGEVPPEVITANSPEPVWFKKMMARRAAFAEDPSKNLDDDQTAVQAILDHK